MENKKWPTINEIRAKAREYAENRKYQRPMEASDYEETFICAFSYFLSFIETPLDVSVPEYQKELLKKYEDTKFGVIMSNSKGDTWIVSMDPETKI